MLSGVPAAPSVGPWRAFRESVLVEALNPKTAAFFLAFVPQFVHPHQGRRAHLQRRGDQDGAIRRWCGRLARHTGFPRRRTGRMAANPGPAPRGHHGGQGRRHFHRELAEDARAQRAAAVEEILPQPFGGDVLGRAGALVQMSRPRRRTVSPFSGFLTGGGRSSSRVASSSMPRLRALIRALEPATARPRVAAVLRGWPSRSATTMVHSVSTGARFTRIGGLSMAMP